jgi:tetratricopeptide (TPR) repeat protein
MARRRYGLTLGKWVAALVLAVIAYLGLQYGAVLGAMDRAADLYSRGDIEGSLAAYEDVERRMRAFRVIRFMPLRDRQNLFLNEARLLYALNQYDDAVERLGKEDEISGTTDDGRFFLLRGNIEYRRARLNYEEATKKDVRVLEEDLLAAEDTLRESLRLNPNDWNAKYNFEFVNRIRTSLAKPGEEKVKLLQETDKPEIKQLPPESAG